MKGSTRFLRHSSLYSVESIVLFVTNTLVFAPQPNNLFFGKFVHKSKLKFRRNISSCRRQVEFLARKLSEIHFDVGFIVDEQTSLVLRQNLLLQFPSSSFGDDTLLQRSVWLLAGSTRTISCSQTNTSNVTASNSVFMCDFII